MPILIALWLLLAILTAVYASSRGRIAVAWFLWGLFFNPFAILVLALLHNKAEIRALQEKVSKLEKRDESDEDQTKK